MPFLFTHAFLLSALAGLGIPVLLHLLLKQRNPRMRVSTLRFFEIQETRSSSRRKLRNLLLLLLRLLVFALIVLAFARPYLPEGWGGTPQPQRRDMILVLDRSLSLRAIDSGKPRWPAALAEARRILATLSEGDRAALIGIGERAEVLSGFGPPSLILDRLKDLQPTVTRGDVGEALREAQSLVAALDSPGAASVTVIGDLQRTGADQLDRVSLPRWLPVQFIRVGPVVSPNVAITDLRLPAEPNGPLSMIVANYGDRPVQNRSVRCLLDGQPVSEIAFSRGAGVSESLEWKLPRLSAGWHEAEVQLKDSDALAEDNVRRLAFQVPERIRVIAVENRSQVRSFEEQTFFVAAALDPFFGATNSGQGGFVVDILRPEAVAAAVSPHRTRPGPDVVLLPAMRSLPGEAVAALNAWVEQGGGVFFFGGDSLEPSRFNAEFGALSPGQWGAPVSAHAEVPWRIGAFDRTSPVFRPFAAARSGGPAVAEFTRRHAVTATPESTVLARFDDGDPFLLGRTVGRGAVLLANTSADTAWTDWPKHKSFVPWVMAAVTWLADRGDERLLRSSDPLITGTEGRILESSGANSLTNSFSPSPATVPGTLSTTSVKNPASIATTPPGSDRFRLQVRPAAPGPPPALEVRSDGTLVFEVPISGFYSVTDDSGRERWRLAANPPPIESDLAALEPSAAEGRLARRTDAESELPPGWFGNEPGRQEWWRILLAAALALLLIETVVANRSTP
ncbi:MAG: vWA domain-containing protein [Limisphaerales bacterium]